MTRGIKARYSNGQEVIEMNGYIRKRGKSWQIIFDLPRDADGKRKQARQTVHGTKRDAEAKMRELIGGLDKGEY